MTKEVKQQIQYTRANRVKRSRMYRRIRPIVQSLFALVWFAPIAAVQSVPACAFHCYACPMASFACPVGLAANAAAFHVWPLILIGLLVTIGSLLGSWVCGWACPVGFFQDLMSKIPLPKFRLPNWLGYGRFATLIGLVIVGPYLFGTASNAFFCTNCPVGAAEAGLPYWVQGGTVDFLKPKYLIAGGLIVLMLFTHRPWCKVFCPLGGFFAMFNRFSLLRLKFDRATCTTCNTCRSRCKMGVEVEKAVNSATCIRCKECTSCGAIVSGVGSGEPQLHPLENQPEKEPQTADV